MLNPFFENFGPFKIEKLLSNAGIINVPKFKNDKIYDVKDLISATKNDLTFFHSKNYSDLAYKTKAAYCLTHENLIKFLLFETIPNDLLMSLYMDLQKHGSDKIKEMTRDKKLANKLLSTL